MLSPVQLRSFCAVVESRHFTQAARRLGLRQSTVSQHVARLEAQLGRVLLMRDTHHVQPTADGETLFGFAREILDVETRICAWRSGSERRARIRFGVSEDLTLDRLPGLLSRFIEASPWIDLDLTVGLSGHLRQSLDAGRLDLVLAKIPAATLGAEESRLHLLWRERPVWVGDPRPAPSDDAPLPIVVYDDLASITRRLAIASLDTAGRRWRLAGTSGTLTGLLAAVRSGLGVSLQSRQVLAAGVTMAPEGLGLPEPPELAFVVFGRSARLQGPAARLAAAIIDGAEVLRGPSVAMS